MTDRHWTTGPELRTILKARCFKEEKGWVRYRYVDNHGKRCPEYAATRIYVIVGHLLMSPRLLAPLEANVRSIPGCIAAGPRAATERERPHVTALFDRQVPQ